MRKLKFYPAFLLGVLLVTAIGQLHGQQRDSIINFYLSDFKNTDSLIHYRTKLYEYTLDKPQFSESHFISCAFLYDISVEDIDSPSNKIYIQSIYNIITSRYSIAINDNDRLDGFRILGDYYRDKYKINEALSFYGQGLSIADTSSMVFNQKYLSALYTNLSVLYIKLDEVNKARLLIEKTIEMDIRDWGPISEFLGIDYIYLGKTYQPIDLQQSLVYYLKSKRQYNLLKSKGKKIWDTGEVVNLYLSLAENYMDLGNLNQALLEIDTAINHTKSDIERFDLILGDALITRATIQQRMGAYQDAIKQYHLADDFCNNKKAPIIYKPNILLQLARCYLALKQPLKAQKQLEKALAVIDQSGPPHQSRLDKIAIPKLLFHLYYEQARVFTVRYEVSQETDFLYKAQTAYQKALAIFELSKKRINDEKSRSIFADKYSDFFESAINLNFLLYSQHSDSTALREILFLSEKNKNDLLYKRLNQSNTSITNALPDSILQKIKFLDNYISKTEKSLLMAQLADDKVVAAQKRDELIQYREKQKAQMIFIKEYFPQYYQLKYHISVPTVKTIQDKLLPEEGMISYYVGAHHLYLLLFDKWDVSVERIPMDFSLSETLDKFNKSILSSTGRGNAANKALIHYHETGFFLYQKLIAPFVRKLPQRLTIIPDNLLENLSFDALLTSLPSADANYKDYPFLLKKYIISYQYAADAFCKTPNKKNYHQHLLAVAPSFSDDQPFSVNKLRDFGKLTHNEAEVDNIKKILGSGTVLKSTKATEANFMTLAPDFQIIHLATHGKVNREYADYSYLAFQEIKDSIENELLYIKDIYGLRLNANMVVLSACETANGSLAQGEGIINLARGFTYAGAASVVSTLWKISDVATNELMETFYLKLKSGQPKHLALAQAKRQFLENAPPRLGHPFYWAAFVFTGDVSPIQPPPPTENFILAKTFLWATGTLFFLILMGAVSYLRRRLK